MPPHAAPAPLPVEADDDAFTEDALTEGTPSLVDALVEALVEPPALLADPVESTLPPQPATSLAEAASEKVPTAKRLVLTKEFHDIGGSVSRSLGADGARQFACGCSTSSCFRTRPYPNW